ncbi:MAG: hypothetical protein HQL06_11735 [Nitrospirae bacterium]|nr:hypothetical protein [Nitrospirota bacterium]
MKDVFIILCTEDMYHPVTRQCIEHIKAADLTIAELIVYDNAYNPAFVLADIYEDVVDYCEGRPIILLNDRVIVKDPLWVYRLMECSNSAGASIVGCIHSYRDETNSYYGIDFRQDAHLNFLDLSFLDVYNSTLTDYTYVCALAGPAILLMKPNTIHFDPDYHTDHIHLDICMQEWLKGRRVAASLNLNVTNVGDPLHDLQYFKDKWGDFIKNELRSKIESNG